MILDTNALSAILEGDRSIEKVISVAHSVCLPVIVIGEYGYSVKRSVYRKFYEDWLDGNLGVFEILDVKMSTAKVYSKLRLDLKKNGTPIPENDVWISALAIERKMPILSRDKHFEKVRGLEVLSW